MKSPEEIESSLKRLIPAAVSEELESRIFAEISQAAPSPEKADYRFLYAVAALVLVACSALMLLNQPRTASVASVIIPPVSPPQIISTSAAVKDVDEGIFISEQGNIHRAVKRRIVKQEKIRDAKTGYVITVNTQRSRQVFMPVNSF